MLNHCVLSGHLGQDPEVKTTGEGTMIASFSLAFRSSKKNTGWIKVTCFNRLAEVAERYLHKGARIGLAGALEQQKWETEEGQPRSAFGIVANSIEFIKTDGRGFEQGANGDEVPF